LRDGYGPEEMYIGPSDRKNQSFVTGIALTGVPLTILLLAPCVRWARRRFPHTAPPRRTAGRSASKRRPAATRHPVTATRPTWRRLLTPSLALALAAAAAIVLTAPGGGEQEQRN
ncbi:hypothetical protein ACFW2E_23695, partial [Streptomyces sp. NPDC058964]